MNQAPVPSPDPQTAIVVAEQPLGFELPHNAWEWIRLGFSVNEPMDSALPVDQQRAFTVFTYAPEAVRLAGQRIEFWQTRYPYPQPALHSRPDAVFTVLIQTEHETARSAILSVALDATIPNG